MMQGDQYRVPISLELEDRSPVTMEIIDDIEVFVGSVRKTVSDGVTYDETSKTFYAYLIQKETFRLHGDVDVQARVLFKSGDVVGVNLGSVNFETSTSKVVLR